MSQKKFAQAAEKDNEHQISEEFHNTPEYKMLTAKADQLKRMRNLFKNCNFYLNRETPIYALQHFILGFGGNFMSDDDELLEKEKITHHVIDRPLAIGSKQKKGREYIQPQWIMDTINNLHMLPTQAYAPGIPPPPHLSPFIDNQLEGYVPQRQKQINQFKGEEV